MSENRFENWKQPEIKHGELTRWNWMVQHPEKLEVSAGTDIGAFCYINAKHGVFLGEGVQIGSHTSIYSESTIDGRQGKVVIEDGARVGTHSAIMPGVKIGENAVVGAFSYVNCDIPPNVTAYGVPAKVVGSHKNRDEE